jgi:hypothetical protein
LLIDPDNRYGWPEIKKVVNLTSLRRIGTALSELSVLKFRLNHRPYMRAYNYGCSILEVQVWRSLYDELQITASIVFRSEVRVVENTRT